MIQDIKRFIVVDDDSTNNLICSFMLKRFFPGVEVMVYQKPVLAIEEIKTLYNNTGTNIPTVLFLDVNMPVLSGWDFLEIFATYHEQVHQQIKIYMLSSSVDHRDRQQAGANRFVSGYVSKPLTAEWIKENLFEQAVV